MNREKNRLKREKIDCREERRKVFVFGDFLYLILVNLLYFKYFLFYVY